MSDAFLASLEPPDLRELFWLSSIPKRQKSNSHFWNAYVRDLLTIQTAPVFRYCTNRAAKIYLARPATLLLGYVPPEYFRLPSIILYPHPRFFATPKIIFFEQSFLALTPKFG